MASLSLRRIMKDLKELDEEPIEGVSLCCSNDSAFELHGDMLINTGPYNGLYLHLHVKLAEDYPHSAPEMYIDSSIPFDHRFHSHVHPDSQGRLSICNDMTANFLAHFGARTHSGWSSACTLKSLMLNTIIFFSDPELEKLPEIFKIDELKDLGRQFICAECNGSWKRLEEVDGVVEGIERIDLKSYVDEKEKEEPSDTGYLSEWKCYSCKESSSEMVIGYPVHASHNKYRLFFSVFVQPLCFDCFRLQVPPGGNSTTAFGNPFNRFLPLILESSIEMNVRKNVLLECLQSLPSRALPPTATPLLMMNNSLEYVAMMMNNIVIDIFKGESHTSTSLIEGFCQLLQIAVFILNHTPQCGQNLVAQVTEFQNGKTSKQYVPDIGLFLMKIFLSQADLSEVKLAFLKEYFARQVYWMRHDGINEEETAVDRRLSEAFHASKVSNGLYMVLYKIFQAFINPTTIAALNANYGMPDSTLTSAMVELIRSMKSISTFEEYTVCIDAKDIFPDDIAVFDFLNNAIDTATIQGYI